MKEVIVILENADDIVSPFAKMPEIVRCKDCRFAHLTYDGMCKQCEQIMDDEDNMLTLYFPGDHYCSYGERKEVNKK